MSIFELADMDHSGHVSFQELNMWLALYQPGYVSEEERLTHVFNAYDLDRDGELHGTEWNTMRNLIKHNLLGDWERQYKKKEEEELKSKREQERHTLAKVERLDEKRQQRIFLQRRKLERARKEVQAFENTRGSASTRKEEAERRLQQAIEDVKQAERYKKKLERKALRDNKLKETREVDELERRKLRHEAARLEAERVIDEDIRGMELKLVDSELRTKVNYITVPKKKWLKYGMKSNLSKALLGQQLHEILQPKEKKRQRHHQKHHKKHHLRHRRHQQKQRKKFMMYHSNQHELPLQDLDMERKKWSLFKSKPSS